MDWTGFWMLAESLSDSFYQPLLFWGVPFIPAIAAEIWKTRRA